MTEILCALIGLFLGYQLAVIKPFWEEKQRVYREILPVFQKMAYEAEQLDPRELNKALVTLWLYGSTRAALAMNRVVSIRIKPERGNLIEALQEAIIEMRKDIHRWSWSWPPWKTLKADDISHLYIQIVERRKEYDDISEI